MAEPWTPGLDAGVLDERPTTPSPPPTARFPPTFEQMAAQGDDHLDVALGAALIAKDVYCNLDVSGLLLRFEELASPLVGKRLESEVPEAQAVEMARHVYTGLGFRGNETDYYDPRNSLLPDVLDRRLGIPISLAIVYCEIARRVGVPARGVAFPGHFLVRIERSGAADDPVIVDPFFSGRRLGRDALERLLRRALGPRERLRPEHLAPAAARTILVRVLTNLKAIHLTRGEHARAHLALDRIVSLTPDAPGVLRERGLLAARLGAMEAARADLTRVLELDPKASDAAMLEARLAELRVARRALN